VDEFSRQSAADRKPFLEAAATTSGLPFGIIEKDFWVCWTLKRLFELPTIRDHLIFKGGTTLSKIYAVIERFSEDIDVSIDRVHFGFVDGKDPEKAGSAKKQRQVIEELAGACRAFVQGELQTVLRAAIEKTLGTKKGWKLSPDGDDPDGQTLLFEYPAIDGQSLGYVRPSVKIELGARSDHWPSERRGVRPYLAEHVAEALRDPEAQVKVLDVARTFWEKATILHMYAHWPEGKKVSPRQSRHYYDLFRLLGTAHKVDAVAKPELLKRVAEHKRIYFRAGWAKYEAAGNGGLKLAPSEHVETAMKQDYAQMGEMIFGDAPTWAAIMVAIRAFEAEMGLRRETRRG